MKCPACGKSLWFRLPACPYCHAPLGPAELARPWTVSLPCWIFFALGFFNLVTVLLTDWTPGNEGWRESFRVKAPLAFYLRYVMPVIMMSLVFFMLNGRNWARWVFVVWFGNTIFWQALKTPKSAWPLALLFGVCTALWFLPRSTRFFTGVSVIYADPPFSSSSPPVAGAGGSKVERV